MKVTGAFSDDRECYAPNKMKSDPSATATGGNPPEALRVLQGRLPMAMTPEAGLCEEYWEWTAEHGLPYVSANALAHEPGLLTDEERRYIANFIKRWVNMKGW